jgi:hypothetical protein
MRDTIEKDPDMILVHPDMPFASSKLGAAHDLHEM